MTTAGDFLMSQRLSPVNPVAEMLLIHVPSSLLPIFESFPNIFIQFWLLTAHLYLPSMVDEGKGHIIVKIYIVRMENTGNINTLRTINATVISVAN